VVARLAHVEARTLQKWIAQGLVVPSFYLRHEQRSPKKGSINEGERKNRRFAAFRPDDLPAVIDVRNRARVRTKRQPDKGPLEEHE